MMNIWFISSAAVGYLLGSLPFGYWVARAHGVDIFKVGSGNPGATNVKRTLGAKAGNTVLALDVAKGAIATAWPLLPMVAAPAAPTLALIGVVAAVLGHSFSIFTGFRGGKGVATAAGGLLVLTPVACAIAAATWVVALYVFRYVSLASILAATAAITASWLLPHQVASSVIVSLLAGFVIVRHHENIKRLLSGTENKWSRKPRV